MLQLEVLILELVAVDGLATSAIVVGEIASLAHELRDDAVESGSLVAESFLAGAQGTEILGRTGNNVSTKLIVPSKDIINTDHVRISNYKLSTTDRR